MRVFLLLLLLMPSLVHAQDRDRVGCAAVGLTLALETTCPRLIASALDSNLVAGYASRRRLPRATNQRRTIRQASGSIPSKMAGRPSPETQPARPESGSPEALGAGRGGRGVSNTANSINMDGQQRETSCPEIKCGSTSYRRQHHG